MTLTNAQRSGFVFAIDRGGTFTDIFCELPNGKQIVLKLLSEDPNNYDDVSADLFVSCFYILVEFEYIYI